MYRFALLPAVLAAVSACTFDAMGLTVPSQVSYFGEDSSSTFPTTGADTPTESEELPTTSGPDPFDEPTTDAAPSTSDDAGLTAFCGDGVVGGDEECDDGMAGNADDRACTSTCHHARCGDGHLQPTNGETCDAGDANTSEPNYGGCSLRCTRGPHCGDGEVQDLSGEECEPHQVDDETDTCLPTCLYEARILFVTSVATSGDLGGLAGADKLCNDLASAGELPGTYRAWLLRAGDTLPYRFPELFALSPLKFVNRHGDVLAKHLHGLVLLGPSHPVAYDEHGEARPEQYMWANILAHGKTGEDCDQWTGGEGSARVGFTGYLPDEGSKAQIWHDDEQWTDRQFDVHCSDASPRLYCIQVTA